jgi:hypothetical protein
MKKVFKSIFAILIAMGGFQAQAQDANQIYQTIPNPIEVSTLIKGLGAEYRKSNLNDNTKVNSYSTSFQKALNLGVYSTDLGMANLYTKNQDVINYLDAVKTLADGLQIGDYFDYNTLKDYATKGDKLEELLQITNQNVEKINGFLTDNKREHISVLMVTGGWIEANYLMVKVYNETKNVKIKERIGEGKIVLEKILPALEQHASKPEFKGLIAELKELNDKFKSVKIEEIDGGQEMVVDGDELKYIQKKITKVSVSDSELTAIFNSLSKVRTSIVK